MDKASSVNLGAGMLLLATTSIAFAAPVNLIDNPGFESGDLSGWTVGGNATYGVDLDGTAISGTAYLDNVVNTRAGEYAAWAAVSANSSPQVYVSFSQTLAVAPNQTYDVGFWLSIGTAAGSSGRDYSIFVNGEEILHVDETGHSGTDYWYGLSPLHYLHESVQYTTGSDEVSVTVEYVLSGSGTGLVGFSYDNFHFYGSAAVPLPGAAWLFISGLIGVLGLARYGAQNKR